MPPVNLISPEGKLVTVPEEQAQWYIDKEQYRPESAAEGIAATERSDRLERYQGTGGAIVAAGAGFLRSATGGLSDVAGRALGVGDDLANFREAHPNPSLVGELGGYLAPGGFGGLVERSGGLIGDAAEGAGALSRLGRAGGRGAIEGAVAGAQQGVSELALSDDPLTVERAGSVLSSNMLFGGAIGGAAGTLGKAAELGLSRAKTALDKAAASGSTAGVAGDLANLDAKGLRVAKQAELDAIEAGRVPERANVADEIAAHRKQMGEDKVFLATKGAEDPEIRSLAARSRKADVQLRNLLDNPKALAENPKRAIAALQQQESALEGVIAKADDIRASHATRLPETAANIPEDGMEMTLRPADLKKRGYEQLGTEAGGDFEGGVARDQVRMEKARARVKAGRGEARITIDPSGRIVVDDGRHTLAAAIESGAPVKVRIDRGIGADGARFEGQAVESASVRGKALDAAAPALERNRALQKRIGELSATPASERLAQITDAMDVLTSGGKKQGIAEKMLGGTVFGMAAGAAGGIPLVGHAIAPLIGAGAANMVNGRVFGRIGAAISEQSARASKAISAVLNVTKKIAPSAPVLATKVLSRLRYSTDSSEAPEKRSRGDLASVYKRRAAEIHSQMTTGPDGKLAMKPAARAKIASHLGPVGALHPLLADKMESLGARKLEYLAASLPKRPDLAGIDYGPDHWQPSDMEMRAFARRAAAADDPIGVLERAASGQITPEDAETMKAVYPEMLGDFTRQVIEGLPELSKKLPYRRRLALSILTGVPVDPALDPRILSVLQQQHEGEEGSEGGTQAPKAMPAFGSVRSQEKATPSQERSG